MSSYKFIISGGGTGGHIFPAIAIADGLKKEYPDASFLFVGAQGKMEMQKVPKAGYPIKGLWISGLSRKISLSLFLFPLKLCYSLLQAFFILLRFRPNLVVGTGGYASAPLLKMAQFMGIGTLLQEQIPMLVLLINGWHKKPRLFVWPILVWKLFFLKKQLGLLGTLFDQNLLLHSQQGKPLYLISN